MRPHNYASVADPAPLSSAQPLDPLDPRTHPSTDFHRHLHPGHGSFVRLFKLRNGAATYEPYSRSTDLEHKKCGWLGWLVLKRKQIVVWITTKVHFKLREVPIPPSDRSQQHLQALRKISAPLCITQKRAKYYNETYSSLKV